jgi:hypothetical protein
MYLHNVPRVMSVSLVLSSDGPSISREFPGERSQTARAIISEDDFWLILNLLKVSGPQEVDIPRSMKVVNVIVLSRVMMHLSLITRHPFIGLVSWDLWLFS